MEVQAKLRITRTIVYEGGEGWIRKVLDKSLKLGRPLTAGKDDYAYCENTVTVLKETREVLQTGDCTVARVEP